MSRKKTWEVSDAFWELVQPLIPTNPRVAHKTYQRQQGGGRKPKYSNRLYFSAMVYVLRNGIIWNALPREKFGAMSSSALHDKFQQSSIAGVLPKFGSEVWPNTTNYKELLGLGKQQIVRASKHLWPENLAVQTRRIGKKRLKTTCSRRREGHPHLVTRQRSQPA